LAGKKQFYQGLDILIQLGADIHVKVGLNLYLYFDLWTDEQFQHCLDTLIQLGADIHVKVRVKTILNLIGTVSSVSGNTDSSRK
jgi:hypothetical protein